MEEIHFLCHAQQPVYILQHTEIYDLLANTYIDDMNQAGK